MSGVAFYLGDTCIYWNSILIGCGMLSAVLIGMAFTMADHSYCAPFMVYMVISLPLSLFLAKAIYWYCNMEKFESFRAAMTDFDSGGYCIVGVLIGTWIPALLLSLLKLAESRFDFLDAAAPGIAFLLAMIRFGDYDSGACRGKFSLTDERFFRLPIGIKMESGGKLEYRFAAFFVSFLLLLVIMAVTAAVRVAGLKGTCRKGTEKNTGKDIIKDTETEAGKEAGNEIGKGNTYRLFLLLFCMTEFVIDSIRYDSLHLFFYGEKLAELNKAASFIGLSQLFSALSLLALLIIAFRKSHSLGRSGKYRRGMFAVSLAGLVLAGTCEYLVQRYTGRYLEVYALMCLGLVITGISAGMMLFGFHKK